MKKPFGRKAMGGVTLIELLVVLSIISVVITLAVTDVARRAQIAKAEIAGVDLKHFTTAVRQAIANEGDSLAGGPGGTANYSGHEWLQSAASCGGSATAIADYLPCGFRGFIPFGLTFETTVTHDIPSGTVEAVIRFDDDDGSGTPASIRVGNVDRIDLANVVTTTAKKNDTFRASATGPAGYDIYSVDPDGVIFATATLVQDLDIYIRRDGGNSPTAAINWGGQNLTNANQVAATSIDATDVTAGTVDATGEMSARDYEITGKLISGASQWASEGVSDVRLLTSGGLIPKPVCPSGVPQVFAYPVIFSKNSPAEAIGSVQAWAVDAGANWQINIRVLTPSGWHGGASGFRRVVATTKCAR